MLSKILAAGMAGLLLFVVLIGAVVGGIVSVLPGLLAPPAPQASQTAVADIPADFLALYQQAATVCPGLDWSVLAAIGKVETNHGRSTLPGVAPGTVNSAGAAGDMQFLQPTFDTVIARHPLPPGGAMPPSRYNAHDAIYAAAFYLCDNGAGGGRDLRGAIFAYNHADSYVHDVLTVAKAYSAAAPPPQQLSPPSVAGGWVVPVQGQCTSGFGPRGTEFHQGQDIAAPIGTPILAAAGGTVIDSGPATGFGLWVRIQHPGGVVTTYGHNNINLVQKGQQVQAGQPIAEVGDRGESTGPHVHFQIEVNGKAVDSVAFYQGQSVPSLCAGPAMRP